eukprot:scaffold278817_cov27-Tisochrysis_lutea.AAC.3
MRYVLRLRTSRCEPNERTIKSCRERAMSTSSVRGSTHVVCAPCSCEVTLSAKRLGAPVRAPKPPLPDIAAAAAVAGWHWHTPVRSGECAGAAPQTMQPPCAQPCADRDSGPSPPLPVQSDALLPCEEAGMEVPSSQTVPEAPVPSTLRNPEMGEGAYSSSDSSRSSSVHTA